MHFLEWNWWEHCEEYVRTGRPLQVHQTMTDEERGVYQRGMRSGIEVPAEWVARKLPLPRGARAMLDVGGNHGYFSVALCRRHPQLTATILDLPEAVRHAAPLLASEGMGDRVQHRVGDVLTEDLGTDAYDLVFMSAVVHHFDDTTNRQLMQRIARALRPGGVVAIWEPARQERGGKIRQIGALLDLFFGFFSEAGTWSADEICRLDACGRSETGSASSTAADARSGTACLAQSVVRIWSSARWVYRFGRSIRFRGCQDNWADSGALNSIRLRSRLRAPVIATGCSSANAQLASGKYTGCRF